MKTTLCSRTLWNPIRFTFTKPPARFQSAAFHVKLMPPKQQRRIKRLAPTMPSCSPVWQRHERQRHIGFPRLRHQVRPQHFQNELSLSRHGNPRIAAVHSPALCHVVLERTLHDNCSKTPNSVRAPHRNLNSQPVRRINNVPASGRSHTANRNAALTVKQSCGPRH